MKNKEGVEWLQTAPCIIQSSPLSVNNYDLQLSIMFGFSSAYLPTTEQQILTFAFIGCRSQQDITASVASPQRNDFLIQFIWPRDNLNCQSHRYILQAFGFSFNKPFIQAKASLFNGHEPCTQTAMI